MKTEVSVTINSPKEAAWKVIADIDKAAERISGIEQVEVLERPEGGGLVGLKWRETRTMFGKTATETMWITDAAENDSYATRAESCGCIYRSTMAVADEGDGACRLTMTFNAEPIGLVGKVMSAMMGFAMKGSMVKMIQKDLEDIKAAVEAGGDAAGESAGDA